MFGILKLVCVLGESLEASKFHQVIIKKHSGRYAYRHKNHDNADRMKLLTWYTFTKAPKVSED